MIWQFFSFLHAICASQAKIRGLRFFFFATRTAFLNSGEKLESRRFKVLHVDFIASTEVLGLFRFDREEDRAWMSDQHWKISAFRDNCSNKNKQNCPGIDHYILILGGHVYIGLLYQRCLQSWLICRVKLIKNPVNFQLSYSRLNANGGKSSRSELKVHSLAFFPPRAFNCMARSSLCERTTDNKNNMMEPWWKEIAAELSWHLSSIRWGRPWGMVESEWSGLWVKFFPFLGQTVVPKGQETICPKWPFFTFLLKNCSKRLISNENCCIFIFFLLSQRKPWKKLASGP